MASKQDERQVRVCLSNRSEKVEAVRLLEGVFRDDTVDNRRLQSVECLSGSLDHFRLDTLVGAEDFGCQGRKSAFTVYEKNVDGAVYFEDVPDVHTINSFLLIITVPSECTVCFSPMEYRVSVSDR